MSNLELLKIENWNPVINMDWLITNLSDSIKPLVQEYIIDSVDGTITDMDKEIVEFSSIIGERLYSNISIDLKHTKFSLKDTSSSSNNNKYWNSGVGYGYSGRTDWDISKYVKEQENKNELIVESINKIIKICNKQENSLTKLVDSTVLKFLENNICNSTLLEINKKVTLFEKCMEIIQIIFQHQDNKLIDWKLNISKGFEFLRQDISPLLSSIEDDKLNFYISVISVADTISDLISSQNIKPVQSEEIVINISDDESLKTKYFELVKSEQDKLFSNYQIKSTHRFSKHKTESVLPKSIMRITSEFSSMRMNLPNNWDTSIVVKACSDNLNIFSFVITGPKDTPYHNGIYEFHAYFPKDYPNTEPKVLLDTTGNSSVRFNPNLYNCGKVCLSLLGTWSGQDGESWNKSTSTFLQVLVSIQSLILVEQPYFNEPGWERQMHTQEGKRRAFEYNDTIRLENLRWAIVDKFKNPPEGFENLAINHFKMKKEEILKVVDTWISETKKYKSKMEELRDELVQLYEKYND